MRMFLGRVFKGSGRDSAFGPASHCSVSAGVAASVVFHGADANWGSTIPHGMRQEVR